mgnify:CR=1 FL=1
MKTNLKIIALIPARSGSKGLPHKNIKLYKGLPLIAHSINVALASKYISDVYVSSDSEEYNKIALKYGAKVILRPSEIADDLSPDVDTFVHFIEHTRDNAYDLIVHLRPTYPNRSISLLDSCIEYFLQNIESYDSLRTVKRMDSTPFKMYHIEDGNLKPFIKTYKDFVEPYNQARQNFPDCYLHNGCIDIVKTSVVKKDVLSGNNILPIIMDSNDDIDTMEDFIKSEKNN